MYESLKETLNKNCSQQLTVKILPLLKTHIKKLLFSTLTSPRIRRDPGRLVKNIVIYFVRVWIFNVLLIIKPSLALQSTVLYHFVYRAFMEV